MFDKIAGQENVKKAATSMIKTGRIPHALLFTGPYGTGKGETALELARMLLCENGPESGCTTCSSCIRSSKIEHPDLHILFPFRAEPQKADARNKWVDELVDLRQRIAEESYAPIAYEKGRQIVIGLVRDVLDKLYTGSFEGGRKVCVILNAEHLNDATGNTLLKILEEPPDDVNFILTTERLSSVLPTITSRSSIVRFRRLKESEISESLEKTYGINPELSKTSAHSAEGSLKTAKEYVFEAKADKRSEAVGLYNKIAGGKQDEVVGDVVPFMWSRDVAGTEELLSGFVSYTRLILEKKFGLRNSEDDNSEHAFQLSKQAKLSGLYSLAAALEDGFEMLGRNVNISTVMTSVFYGINDTYRHKQNQR